MASSAYFRAAATPHPPLSRPSDTGMMMMDYRRCNLCRRLPSDLVVAGPLLLPEALSCAGRGPSTPDDDTVTGLAALFDDERIDLAGTRPATITAIAEVDVYAYETGCGLAGELVPTTPGDNRR